MTDRIEANAALKVLCHHFIKAVNTEHESLARVAFEAHPDLQPADGWRFDGFSGVFVKQSEEEPDA